MGIIRMNNLEILLVSYFKKYLLENVTQKQNQITKILE